MKNLYLIGLTGNLGSGKSTVRKMLEHLGARGIDADALAHAVVRRGTSTWRAVVEAFGADILAHDGRIDRQKLSARVFADAGGLARLEAIVHPAVGALVKQRLREEAHAPVVVIEAIKLIEAGMHSWCDAIWVVKCTPAVQIERVMRERQMSAEDARARLAVQSPLADKLGLAHVVIDNSRDADATRVAVEQAWRAIQPETARDKSEWLFELAPSTAAAESPAQPAMEKPAAAEQIAASASMPQTSAWANVAADVQVRRARRSDLNTLSIALAKVDNQPQPLSRSQIIQRLGERGYRIAIIENRIVALAAWEAENLVAIVREVWAESADAAPIALPKLLTLIEEDANGLLCEVVLLLIDEAALTLAAEANAAGYALREFQSLQPVWQSVTQERMRPTDRIWFKRLREGMTSKPV